MPLTSACEQAFLYRPTAPGQVFLFLFGLAVDRFGEGDQPFGGVGPAIEQYILDALQQGRVQVLVDGELTGVDDTHVHSGLNGMIEERRVDRLAHGVVAPEREADIADAAADLHQWQVLFDLSHRLEIGQGVFVVFLNARGHGKDVGVEDDVLRQEAGLFGQDLVGAPGRSRPCAPRCRPGRLRQKPSR